MSCIRIAPSDALHSRARAFVAAFEASKPMPEAFDGLAVALARFQAERCPGYARLCAARHTDLAHISRSIEAPAVPTDAFKVARVATFPAEETRAIFRTSGTTLGERGRHEMRTTATYDAGALAFGRWALTRDLDRKPSILVVGPSPSEMPDSSLTHMMDLFVRELGEQGAYFVEKGILDLAGFDETVSRLLVGNGPPALVLGTSLGLAHLLDALDGAVLSLPAGSRVMQTGGFKGKSREVDPGAFTAEVARALATERVISEYGMTELSSQFYAAADGVYVEPPWARVIPVDPETLAPVPEGEVGIARIEDLLNVESAFAVQTADRVKRVPGGFELLGRAEGATPRGCSIGIDEMMA